MKDTAPRWLEEILESNRRFQQGIRRDTLPVARAPCPYAVITCMDPRVNLEALGVPSFTAAGETRSQVRVIRTIGAMSEGRSLVIGVFLAGFTEVALVMHSDCGCCLAHSKIDTIVENMRQRLAPEQLATMRSGVGEPFRERLIEWLKAFQNPREAVEQEIAFIRTQPFVPKDLILHGLVYELSSGAVEVVVDGYR
jgi:carbonic anhydrase